MLSLPRPGQPHAIVHASDATSPLDLDPAVVTALYRAHGALLLRGFGTDLAAFRAFTAQFCSGSVFNESPDRGVLDAGANIQTVNGGGDPFPLHPELSREPWKPDVAFFACLAPPRTLGATTIADGCAIVEALPPPVRAAFAGRRLRYVMPAPPEMLAFWLGTPTPDAATRASPPPWCPYSFPAIGGIVVRSFSRPALHRPMFDARPAFGNFLLFARYYLGRRDFPLWDDLTPVPDALLDAVQAAAAAVTVPVRWQAGDLLMLDNTRFMHGREAVVPDDGRLIASFFGYLRDARPDPEEPADAIWRRGVFRPPMRAAVSARG